MDTSRSGGCRWRMGSLLLCLLLISPLLNSCATVGTLASPSTYSSIHPVVKIGLLAPFEGLHRRSGYEALAAMRLALEAYSSKEMAIIPLALHIEQLSEPTAAVPIDVMAVADGTTVQQRTAQKLLADPAVKAVVGPYAPPLVEHLRSIMSLTEIPWFLPFSVNPAVREPVFALQAKSEITTTWATMLIQDVARVAAATGAERLVLAGWQPGWPAPTILETMPTAVPVIIPADPIEEVERITALDALFWLGSLEAGVSYLASIRERHPTIPFWFGQNGDDPILSELLFDQLTFDNSNVYWVTWLDENYFVSATLDDASAAEPNPKRNARSLSPTAYLTFRATQAAIAIIDPAYVPPVSEWCIAHFALQSDGTSRAVSVNPE